MYFLHLTLHFIKKLTIKLGGGAQSPVYQQEWTIQAEQRSEQECLNPENWPYYGFIGGELPSRKG